MILEGQKVDGGEFLSMAFVFMSHVSSERVGGDPKGKVGV